MQPYQKKYDTLQPNYENNESFENKMNLKESQKQYRSINLNVPKFIITNKTIFLGQPFYNTQQLHQLLNKEQLSDEIINQYQKQRPFIGMLTNGLQFNSNFESANLDRVDCISNDEYNLYMRIDTNSNGHSNWYYFKITNNDKRRIKFNICNFTKPQSLYMKGLKPYVQSKKSQQKEFIQQGDNIKYQLQGEYYVLSFYYQFEYEDDEVYFSTLPPYTYTQLINKIKKWSKQYKQCLKKIKLTTTLSGLVLPLLIITDKNLDKNKKIIILTARVHPSETCSSYMIQGFIQFLLGESFMAQYLRKNFIFKILPMLNPDGVVVGNYRNGLSGVDLNRQFLENDLTLLPEVKALKNLIEDCKDILIGYFDFHGHQVRKNIFIYGPQLNNNNINQDIKIIPLFLQQRLDSFRFKSCEFGIPKFKIGTARAFANQFVDIICYTVEASFYGYLKGKNFKFTIKDWILSGQQICETLFLYFNMKIQNSKQLKQSQLLKTITEMSLKVEQIEQKHESDDDKDSQSDAEIFEDYNREQLLFLQNQMRNELSQQNINKNQDQERILKNMKVQSVSRKIKAQPLCLIQKKDSRRPLIYPELSIQNWQFKDRNTLSIENKNNQTQKRAKTNCKLLQSFRIDNRKRITSLQESSPINQTIQQINITSLIPRKTIYNFPVLDNLQQQFPHPFPFIKKILINGNIKKQSMQI